MINIDTNIVVRLLTNDEPIQVKKAKNLVAKNDIFIPKTVILESAWVLIYTYKLEKKVVVNSLLKLASLSNVVVENLHSVLFAFSLANDGMDIADALHLTSSDVTDEFATFDKHLIKMSKKLHSEIRAFSP